MPAPHDHVEWKKKKQGRGSNGYRREKRDKDPATPPGKASAQNKKKLALNEKLSTALVTQHNMTPDEANDLFNLVYTEAEKDF